MVNVRAALWLTLTLALFACADLDAAPEVHFAAEGPPCSDARACVTENLLVREVAGIPVLHRPLPGSPVVAMRVVFDGGAGRWTPTLAHAEDVMFRLVSWWGSERHGSKWDKEVAALGARFSVYSGIDYASFTMVAPAVHFEQSWALLTDAIVWPPLPETTEQLGHVKGTFLNGAETALDEAPGAAARTGWSLITENHPYAIRGEAARYIPTLTAEDVKQAADELRRKSRMTVAVVGDVATADVERLVKASFTHLPANGGAPFHRPPPLEPSATRAVILDYPEAPAFHINGYFPAPSPEEPDYAALELGLRVLSARLFEGVRNERGLVYSISAFVSNFRSNYGGLALSTVAPVDAMEATRAIIDELVSEGIDDAELEGERARYVTSFHEGNGTAAGLAFTLLDWRLTTAGAVAADDHLARIEAVTAEEARAAVERYLPGIRYGAAGPPSIPFDEAALSGEAVPNAPAP